MATSPTPSPKKPAAKAAASVADRLLAVKRSLLVSPLIAAAALSKRTPSTKRIALLEADMKTLGSEMERVSEIRERLTEVPALVQKAGIL